jgi:uncharacterized lipoprotein YbaY/heat shock protein HslJ
MDKKIVLGLVVAVSAIGLVVFAAISFKPVVPVVNEEATLSGTVSYSKLATLPSGSLIEIQIRDISKEDAPYEIVAYGNIVTDGGDTTVPFEITYSLKNIYSNRVYAVFARATTGSELKGVTDYPIPLFKNEIPIKTVDLTLSVASEKDNGVIKPIDLEGKRFRIVSLNGTKLYGNLAYLLDFSEGFVYSKICNSMFGGFTIANDIIKSQMVSTLKLCPEPSNMMEIEGAVSELFAKGAAISLSQGKMTLSGNGKTLVLEEVLEEI